MAISMECSAAAQVGTATGLCLEVFKVELQPTPLHTLCAAHAKCALPEVVGRRLELLPSGEATTPLALLGLGQHTPGKTIGEEQEKGYLVQHKFHSMCSHLPSLRCENKGPKEKSACEDSLRYT